MYRSVDHQMLRANVASGEYVCHSQFHLVRKYDK